MSGKYWNTKVRDVWEVLEHYSQNYLGTIGTLKSEMSGKHWNTIVISVWEVSGVQEGNPASAVVMLITPHIQTD